MENEELIKNSFSSAFGEKQQFSDDKPFPDEIPRFSLSPGRSISPIDADFLLDKSLILHHDGDEDEDEELDQLCQPLSLNFVSLSDIDAQITPLKAKGLQTIFEGVFLETPPRSGGRTVIPRKKCDITVKVLGLQSTSSSSEDEDHDDQVTPLCESFIEQQQRLEDEVEEEVTETEIIISRRGTVSCSSIKEQLVVASLSAEPTITSSFCNAFQQRLNLIPGED